MVVTNQSAMKTRAASLRSSVLAQTGQDVSQCCSCALCEEITDDVRRRQFGDVDAVDSGE